MILHILKNMIIKFKPNLNVLLKPQNKNLTKAILLSEHQKDVLNKIPKDLVLKRPNKSETFIGTTGRMFKQKSPRDFLRF